MHSCYFCLSAIYCKSSGIDISLYTDYEFGQVLDKAPYENRHIVFDEYDKYSNINKFVWAWPKFIALDMVPRDTIHIDGDVFLKDKSCESILDFNGNDVIVQHLERSYHLSVTQSIYDSTYDAVKHLKWPDFIKNECPSCMPNNGVMGIKNETLWKQYKSTYWDMYNQCTPDAIVSDVYIVPDIIFEQHFLKEICDTYGYSIKYLLNGNTFDDINKDAIDKHYQHVCVDKHVKLKYIISLIKKKDPICYESLRCNWENKYPEYFTYE